MRYVDEDPALWQSLDPDLRALGVTALLSEEHRLWALPLEIARDYRVLPAIAKAHGPAAADLLSKSFPAFLDEHVLLVQEQAKSNASARERQARTRDVRSCVEAVIMAALYDGYLVGDSLNKNYMRAAARLGVDRGAVRRADISFRRRMDRTSLELKNASVAGLALVITHVREHERRLGPPRGVRNRQF
ncbi:hypothetical protein [Rhizobium sp.]|uniref:hypothetical protein n=1 Tax=Rhizobium sp. TaxID=391 RepID=UPI0028ACD627